MIAKDLETLSFYQQQFEARTVDKYYLAAVF
jgi:23S rRNA-/tRNA-specific pseudouridylate synthase